MGKLPELSVLITPDGHTTTLDRIVDSLAGQVAAPGQIEVIFVYPMSERYCKHSVNRVNAQAADRVQLRILDITNGSRSRAWNLGVSLAAAPLVWFLGDDYIPEPKSLTAHIRCHQFHPEENWVGVGPVLFPAALRRDPFRRWLEDSGELLGVSYTTAPAADLEHFFHGANTSFKRTFLSRVGLFDEHFRFHTTNDFEFALRARQCGMRVEHLPDAGAIHEHLVYFRERQRAMWESGFSNAWLEQKHPNMLKPSTRYIRSPWSFWARAWKSRLRYLLGRNPSHRVRFWQNALLSAEVHGYQAGLAALRNSSPT